MWYNPVGRYGGCFTSVIEKFIGRRKSESWGTKVLFIDMDKQANASTWFGRDKEKGTLGNILVSGTDAEEVANIRPMTAAQVIKQTHYPRIDLIATAPNLLDINLAILKNKVGR